MGTTYTSQTSLLGYGLGVLALLVAPTAATARCGQATPCASGPIDLGDMLKGVAPQSGAIITDARGISGDGNVIVGLGQASVQGVANPSNVGFIWRNGKLTRLGGVSDHAYGFDANRDGSVIVGTFVDAAGEQRAFRWTTAKGLVDLDGKHSAAWGVSDDGSAIAGQSDAWVGDRFETHAFRWTKQGGLVDINPGSGWGSMAYDISGNGDVVVGVFGTGGTSHAFRWATSQGFKDLGTLRPDSLGESQANAVNRDGSVVVGWSSIVGGNRHPFRWTKSAGMVDLGALNAFSAEASAVSDDGSVVVGWSSVDGPSGPGTGGAHAFRWTEATGIKDLNALLATAGVDMKGITLSYAKAISGNGQIIVAQGGYAPQADLRAYIARYIDPSKTHGQAIAALATPEAIQSSIDALASSFQATLIASEAFGEPAWRADFRHQVFQLPRGLELTAGMGSGEKRVSSTRRVDGNIALRQTTPALDGIDSFVELGAWTASLPQAHFRRIYANGSGTSQGDGTTSGRANKAYLRAGAVWHPFPADALIASAEVSKVSVSMNPYYESLSPENPLEAAVFARTNLMAARKAKLAWEHGFARWGSFALWGSVGRSQSASLRLSGSIPGVGELSTNGTPHLTWAEFGARGEVAFSERAQFGLGYGAVTSRLGSAQDLSASARWLF